MPARLGAETFLYLSPTPGIDEFAQCSTCRDWVGKMDRCYIHGPHVNVTGTMSCGLYVEGPGFEDLASTFAMVSPMESGLVDREVRCENCRHMLMEDDTCGFFKTLNEELPELFDIDINIDAKGCCNAQQSRQTETD